MKVVMKKAKFTRNPGQHRPSVYFSSLNKL